MTMDFQPNGRVEWPVDGLERIGHCPICRSAGRELLHCKLTDRVFCTAPGEWTMWRCTSCRSGYLDPRPSKDTIGLAYSRYYTHEPIDEQPAKSVLRRFRSALGNDYRRAKYKARLNPIVPLIGRFVVKLLPRIRRQIDLEFRFLPSAPRGAKLLDVGCGNGNFLRTASKAGWEVAGVEPDSEARKMASTEGMDIRATVREWTERPSSFDYVTASHVIEHVHDPIELLSDVHGLLTPGGRLFVQTPNIDAPTHDRFGPYWRGLEPPRHLVLFNRQSLTRALTEAGFGSFQFVPFPEAAELLVNPSTRIAKGLDPYSGKRVFAAPPAWTQIPDDALSRSADEFLTIIAEKPR